MKKQYMKPQTKVVKLMIHHMLVVSPGGWNGEVGAPSFGDNDRDDFE